MPPQSPRISDKLIALLKAIAIILICAISVYWLFNEIRQFEIEEIRKRLAKLPSTSIYAGLVLVVLNYTVFIGYDLIALREIHRKLPLWQVSFASLTGTAAAYNFGSLLGGSPVRSRLYATWGLSAVEITQLLVLIATGFWLGFTALAGTVLTLAPLGELGSQFIPQVVFRLLGLTLLLGPLGWAFFMSRSRRPFKILNIEVTMPPIGSLFCQYVVSIADFAIAASCLYVLLPNTVEMPFIQFLGVFLLAAMLAMISNVPGGVGVFEAVVFKFCGSHSGSGVVAALIAFRIIYFLFPLLVSLLLVTLYQVRPHYQKIQKFSRTAGDTVEGLIPRFMAYAVIVCGAILTFSGATPPIKSRIEKLKLILPLEAVEVSHFLASLAGAALMLLGHGMLRRLDSAWWAAMLLLLISSVLNFMKGLDYEEAIIALILMGILFIGRKEFYRKGSILRPNFSSRWMTAVITVVICAIGISLFTHKHLEYTHEMFWQFAFDKDAPRALRAQVAIMLLLMCIALVQLMGASRVITQDREPLPEDLETSKSIIKTSPVASANLALLSDKTFLFNDEKTAFLMYSVQGRSWVVMGDPVGDPTEWRELLWKFREECDRYDAWPVFYQVSTENIPLYIDLGFVLLKLGEEARVKTETFSMSGNRWQSLRSNFNKFRKEGAEFTVVPPEEVPELLSELKVISDQWLDDKQNDEKGFSLGFFDEDYLKNFPCAIVRVQGKIVAFATLWMCENHEEFAIDLMRHLDSPKRMMDYMFIELILWGQANGYKWFNMGMAPLAGIEAHELSPTWNKMAAMLFKHGDRFYSFEGLRDYKNKFAPVWSARYLAAPGGMALPRILADVTRLISQRPD